MLFTICYSILFEVTCTDKSKSGINSEDTFEIKVPDQSMLSNSKEMSIARNGGWIERYPERLCFQVDFKDNQLLVYPIETSTYTSSPPMRVDVELAYPQYSLEYYKISNDSFYISRTYEGFEYSLYCINNITTFPIKDMIPIANSVADIQLIGNSLMQSISLMNGVFPYMQLTLVGANKVEFEGRSILSAEVYEKENRAFLRLVMRNGQVCDYRGIYLDNNWIRDFHYNLDPVECEYWVN